MRTVLTEKDFTAYRGSPRSPSKAYSHFQFKEILKNLEEICDLNSFPVGYVYVIYLGRSYRIRDIMRLDKDFLWPKDVETDIRAVVFFQRDQGHEDDNEKISFLLQEKGIFSHSMVEVVDFITCYNYRCRSLRKKLIKN